MLSVRFTFDTCADCASRLMNRWIIPMPPSRAITIAISDSVTVSIFAEIMGIESSIFSVSLVVATKEGMLDLIKSGADSVKVGVGSGSICITRIVTGSGVPQLTALADCAEVAREHGVTLIADGGIRNSGDITKALVVGADTVMIGSLLAGTDESPGEIVYRGNYRYKVTRGMASAAARRDQLARSGSPEASNPEMDLTDYVPEGVEAIVPYKGSAINVVRQLAGGLRSGLSYCGAETLEELRSNSEFIRITDVGLKESMPHDVKEL